MSSPTIWNGVNAKNLATDYSFSSPTFDGMLVGNQLTHNASTGITSGGVLSINADTTKFNLTAGTGNIVDYSTPTNPSIVKVSWNAFTAQTVTGLAVQDETYILVDSAGAITQLSNFPTPTERRAKIFIGRVGHSTRVLISFATSFPDYGQSVGSQMFDLYDALGPFNISGNQISNNGANLGFQKSAGSLFFRSFNYPSSPQTPHVSTIASAAPVSFFYRDRDSVFTPAVTVIDPTTYDVGGVLTTVPNPGATATIQRVYVSPNGTIQVQYGQTLYNNLTAAIAAIGTDPFIQNPALTNTSVLIGYIVVQKNCLALNDTATSAILRAPKFESGVGGGVNSVVSLQQTYNSSTQPQIVLTSGQGGVQVYDNSTPLGTDLFTVANNAGSTKYLDVTATALTTTNPITTTSGTASTTTGTGALIVTGGAGIGGAVNAGGTITGTQIIDSGLTASTAVYANASKQLTSSATTSTQLGYLSTTTSDVQTQIDRKGDARNYIQDPLFTQGTTAFWSLGTTGALTNGIPTGTPTFGSGASGNLTISATSSGQLEGAYSLQYQHVTNQTVAGNMVSTSAISLDTIDQAKVLGFKFAYKASVNPSNGNFSGTSSNSFGVAVWDVTNSAWLGLAGQFNLVQSSGVGQATGTFQTASNTTSIRFVFYNVNATSNVTGGGAITMLMDDFFLGPQVTSIGPAMSDWVSYTPTLTNITLGNGGSNWFYKRIGDSLKIKGSIGCGTTTSVSGVVQVSLPSGLTIDTAKVEGNAGNGAGSTRLGYASASIGGRTYSADIYVAGASTVSFFGDNITVGGGNWTTTFPATWGNASELHVPSTDMIPISGWSSNTVQSSDSDTRVVAARLVRATSNQSISSTAVTVVQFNSTAIDTHAMWDGTNFRYVAAVSGVYEFAASAGFGSVTAAEPIFLSVRKGGSTISGASAFSRANANGDGYIQVNGQVSMSAGEYIDVAVNSVSDASWVVDFSNNTSLSIKRLSGPAVVQASETVAASYNTAVSGTLTNAAFSYIDFATKEFDRHNSVLGAGSGNVTTSGTGWRWIAPVSGVYQVIAHVSSTFPTTPVAIDMMAAVFVDGTEKIRGTRYALTSTAVKSDAVYNSSAAGLVYLLAGQRVEAALYQNSSANRTMDGIAASNKISIVRVGN